MNPIIEYRSTNTLLGFLSTAEKQNFRTLSQECNKVVIDYYNDPKTPPLKILNPSFRNKFLN